MQPVFMEAGGQWREQCTGTRTQIPGTSLNQGRPETQTHASTGRGMRKVWKIRSTAQSHNKFDAEGGGPLICRTRTTGLPFSLHAPTVRPSV